MIKRTRQRLQKGHIYEKSGSFYIRYYTNISGERRQKAELLCEKDQLRHSKNCRAVKLIRQEFMLKVNSGVKEQEHGDLSVHDFWTGTYFPFISENLRASTVYSYVDLWDRLLEKHFEGRTLRGYKTHHGSDFLTGLAKKYGRTSLAHIRSLASGIFTHAINKGLLEFNPWHEVKILAKVRPPAETEHYTLEEIQDIISALADRVDCQLVMALAYFAALSPYEIAGLRWEDFTEFSVHIQRGVVRGMVDEPKTEARKAPVPLIPQVIVPLNLWHKKCGEPKQGWVFPNERGRPTSLRELARRHIRPMMERQNDLNKQNGDSARLVWKGLYAGRRGAGTILVDLTGSLVAAQELLRHKSMTTTALHYKKKTESSLASGMKLLEEKAK